MLTLGIKPGDYIVVGKNVVIQAVEINNQVHLNIDAPREVPILRGAVYEQNNPVPSCIRRAPKRPT